MKILQVNTTESEGGAAKVVLRINNYINNTNKITSKIYVQKSSSLNENIISDYGKIRRLLNQIRGSIDNIPNLIYSNKNHLFSNGYISDRLLQVIKSEQPDIIHLHWISNGFINLRTLKKIKIPIVWTLHDSWAFTGGCHVPLNCSKYIQECGKCPILGSNSKFDLSYFNLRRKQKIISHSKITFLTPSNWLAANCRQSTILKHQKIINIKNGIDTNIFKPISKNLVTEILNYNVDNKKIILYGANGAIDDKNKGWTLLLDALKNSDLQKDQVLLCIFGALRPETNFDLPNDTIFLGKITDELLLPLIYSYADVLVVPSKLENLSNTIIEGMSCGLPVVAFKVGGNEEIITHQQDGYLANPYDIIDLSKGISWVLNNKNYDELKKNARNKILNHFSLENIASELINIYKMSLINHAK